MRTRLDWSWEKLDDYTWRAQVYGGWVLHKQMVLSKGKETSSSESMVFIPDRDHQWTINPPPKETEKKPSIAKDF